MDSGGSPKTPKSPNVEKLYGQGFQLNEKFLPKFLEQEMNFRTTQDPLRIAQQQGLQRQFGPEQYRQMLTAFKSLDPTYFSNREQFGKGLSSEYALGSKLSPDQSSEIERGVRGAQAARGNISGNAAALAEAYAKGSAGLQLQQQRTQNMAGYMGLPTMPQLAGSVPPVSADRSFGYTNPNAGWQMVNAGMQNFGNTLGSAALGQQTGGSPWMSAVGGILQTIGPILGSLAFSDARLKTDALPTGRKIHGVKEYEFSYKSPQRFRGVMAQDVARVDPAHVARDPASGYFMVSQRYAPREVA